MKKVKSNSLKVGSIFKLDDLNDVVEEVIFIEDEYIRSKVVNQGTQQMKNRSLDIDVLLLQGPIN